MMLLLCCYELNSHVCMVNNVVAYFGDYVVVYVGDYGDYVVVMVIMLLLLW